MRRILCTLTVLGAGFLILSPSLSCAQEPQWEVQDMSSPAQPQQQVGSMPDGDVSEDVHCFLVVNEAPYTVYGSIVTAFFTKPDGSRGRHTSNYRIQKAGTVHPTKGYPQDMAEFCTSGPFYPGQKVEFVIRTFIPVFTCITRIDQGPITIHGEQLEGGGGTKTWATCFE